MAGAAIDTVVFDIGWVLVRFNYQPIIDLLRARGCAVDDLHAVLERAALADHESGRLHGHGLLERLAQLASAPRSATTNPGGCTATGCWRAWRGWRVTR